MGRLQDIENALIQINDAVFQELCDSFLAVRNKNISAFSRLGSQIGKQKTRSGTPDSIFLTPSGKYVFVEHSTDISRGLSKLKSDIDKCLDQSKSGVPVEQIAEIIFCVNFRLKVTDLAELKSLLRKTRISLSVYALDELAIELHLNHRDLVHQYLGLSLDTGQVISLEKFISDYNKSGSGIATPLDNIFLHRSKELSQVKSAIQNTDLIILTGPPGVGKTKLALESIIQFVKENTLYKPYCISYKHHTLLNDLNQYFDNDGSYIVFVDDANRIDAFEQILGFYRGVQQRRLKLVLTVRDYAYTDLAQRCSEFSPIRVDVPKLTDEQIKDIIKSSSFDIQNSLYQNKIINISDGNPRLAIMTALLAKAHQNITVLEDISDLFEKYFATFITDKIELDNKLNFKCLALISFFYTLPYKDREVVEAILTNFDIPFNSFIEVIDNLDRLEIVEIQFEHVKIPEQNLATFFFYKVFIQDESLSFTTLLQKYFETNSRRFTDTVIPANNTFGSRRVMDKLLPSLRAHLQSIKSDNEKAYKFLKVFYFYLQTEALDYAYESIQQLPDSTQNFELVKKQDNFFNDKDELVDLLSDFFYSYDSLELAIELIFALGRKKPKLINDILHELRERLLYDNDDFYTHFERQNILFKVLTTGVNNGDLFSSEVFFDLAPKFLSYRFHRTHGGRRNTIHISEFYIPNDESIKELRNLIWATINFVFPANPDQCKKVLGQYATTWDVNKDVLYSEEQVVTTIFNSHLTPDLFQDCKIVQDMIRCWKHSGLVSDDILKLSEKYTNALYKIFLKIDWDRHRDKEAFDFSDYREYEKLKEDEIRSSFVFDSLLDVSAFYETFQFLKGQATNSWNYNRTLDIIISENFKNNFEIGMQFFKVIIQTDNKIGYVPQLPFVEQLKEKENAWQIWNLISQNDFNSKGAWELSYYYQIDDALITEGLAESIVTTLEKITDVQMIHFASLERFINIKPNLFQEFLRVMVVRNRDGKVTVRAWMNFFDDFFDHLGDDINLIEEAYLQQIEVDHYDYNSKGFKTILAKDNNFLLKFLNNIFKENKVYVSHSIKDLSFVWSIPEIEPILTKALDLLVVLDRPHGISEHFGNSFFVNLVDDVVPRATLFIDNYVRINFNDTNKMNMIVDICRHTMKRHYESVVRLFLTLSQDEVLFSKIYWRGTSTSGTGDVILADIEAADWRNLLAIVNKAGNTLALYKIKKYVHDKVEQCLRSAEYERKQRFLERF